MLSFAISSWAAWAPGVETCDDWVAQYNAIMPVDRQTAPNVKDMPMMLRRRLSRLGRMAMRVAYDAGRGDEARLVFSSRYGEAAQTVGLLQSLAQKEALSPTAFSMSVHNALAGLLSIQQKNRLPHTAIAAGDESFCAGLMEAAALLQEDATTPILLVHYDEPLPEFYNPYDDEAVPSLALAMVLETRESGGAEFDVGFSVKVQDLSCDNSDAAQGFIGFLAQQKDAWSWSAAQRNWWCRRHAA